MKRVILILVLFIFSLGFSQHEMLLIASKAQYDNEGQNDTDAQAFINAVESHGSLTQTTKDAINDLVVGLKTQSLWDKIHFAYPLVGSNAEMMKYNLKDPRNLDEAFRLSWLGSGGTFSTANGFAGQGTRYADTNYIPYEESVPDDMHMSVYAGSSPTRNSAEIAFGSRSGSDDRFSFELAYNTSSYAFDVYECCAPPGRIGGNNGGNPLGYWIATRSSPTNFKVFRDGVELGHNTGDRGTNDISSEELAFNTWNDDGSFRTGSTIGTFDWRFCSVGSSLTDTEATNLLNAVQTFQEALGRGI